MDLRKCGARHNLERCGNGLCTRWTVLSRQLQKTINQRRRLRPDTGIQVAHRWVTKGRRWFWIVRSEGAMESGAEAIEIAALISQTLILFGCGIARGAD